MTVRDVGLAALEQVTAACRAEGRRQLTEWEAYKLLRFWQVPVAPCELAAGPEQAAEAAVRLGGPVAVKVVSPEIGHKTEAGCVRLGVAGAAEAAGACAEVLANARLYAPGARVDGVLVQRMAPAGVEVIAGGLRDRSFGPVLMVGLGGIFTEVLKDVAFRLAPVREEQVLEALRGLRGFPLLTGARGRAPVDLDALCGALANISRLVDAWDELAELDLNPLIAWERGVVAVDCLATLRQP
ncbi:MAG TPA: acetate--CoA ligase family protein [Symbiobacteriaceae bacterium]|jgi:acetate---CoA ligase (ADP-forming) subunit beta|nr:acetate--CoA ligase family protein [Symbiobacteriaceae bacterium]